MRGRPGVAERKIPGAHEALDQASDQLLDHAIQIGITRAEASGEQVPAAFGDPVTVRDHVELACLAGGQHGVNLEALPDEGHETRDL